jgi:hypothetical protein
MKTGSKLAITLFTLVAIAHLLRLLNGIPVTAGDWDVPQWVSILGVAVTGLLAWMLWKESQ